MNNCEACKRINEGADPMTLSLIHTCHIKPVFDHLEGILKPYSGFVTKIDEVDFKLKEDSNVIELPVDDKDLEKEQLISNISLSINQLQIFITKNALSLFTSLDIVHVEGSKNELEVLFETIRDKK